MARSITPPQRWHLQVCIASVLVYLVACAVSVVRVYRVTGGHFSYTLDDPYIHLSLAEQIVRGEYGINPHAPASASSSVLFPFLEAGLLAMAMGAWAGLFLNVIAGVASVWLLVRVVEEGGLVTVDDARPWAVAVVATMVLGLNLVGLTLMGMEHGLHVTLTLAALLGVHRLDRDGTVPGSLLVALALSPLVRYEGAATLLAGVLVLLLSRRVGPAMTVTAVALLGLGLFSWRLHALGLPYLPSSVLAKAQDGVHGLGGQLKANLVEREGVLVLAAMALALAAWLGRGPGTRLATPAKTSLFGVIVLGAHLAVGPFGWRHRYEAYVLALGVATSVLLAGKKVRAWQSQSGRLGAAVMGVTFLMAFYPTLSETLQVPLCARSIYLEQFQVRALVVEHLREPVAANDIGWLSWRNERDVVDLWGLGSEEARRARHTSRDPAWIDRLARAHHARFAAIYDVWFPALPSRWVRLGKLCSRVPMTVISPVSFYAVDAEAAAALQPALRAWRATLPSAVWFDESPGPTCVP